MDTNYFGIDIIDVEYQGPPQPVVGTRYLQPGNQYGGQQRVGSHPVLSASQSGNSQLKVKWVVSGELNRMRKCFQPWQFFVDHWMNSDVVDGDFLMWVYRPLDNGNFQVGYFMPDGTWVPDGEYYTRDEAAARVNYLNGGK